MKSGQKQHAAFTLVELLVVIAIIAVLIAILLPIITKVRRRALVLVCPVAYVSYIDRQIHLTDLRFGHDFAVTSLKATSGNWWPADPIWSPNGQRLGFVYGPTSGTVYICVLDPSSGVIHKHKPAVDGGLFAGWADDDHFIENTFHEVRVRDAQTGAVTGIYLHPNWGGCRYYNAPPGSPGKFVSLTTVFDAPNGVARWVHKDYTNGRPIWTTAMVDDKRWKAFEGESIDVDPTGQWVAWDLRVEKDPRTDLFFTAIKSISDDPSATPTLLNIGKNALWIDDRQLLVGSELRIVDRSGRIMRSSDISSNGPVSLRRYYHY